MSRTTLSFILIILGVLVFYFLFLTQWEGVKNAQADYSAVNRAIDELKSLQAKRDELVDTYNSVKASDLTKADQIITTGPQTRSILVDLEALARSAGVTLKSVDFHQASAPAAAKAAVPSKGPGGVTPGVSVDLKGGVLVLPLNLTVSGGYSAFRKFLSDLEVNQRLFDAVSITFGVGQGQAAGNIDVGLQLKAYYQ